jgi:outer membrane protein TolC
MSRLNQLWLTALVTGAIALTPSLAFAQGEGAALGLIDTVQLARDNSLAAQLARQQLQGTEANRALTLGQVLRAQGLADVSAETVTQTQEQLRLGELKLKAGTGTRAEVLQLRANLANAQGALTQARNGVNIARLQLSNAVNAPVGDRPLDTSPSVPALAVSPDKDLAAGIARRTEVQRLSLQQQASETQVGLESRALWPNVSAVGRYSQRGFNQGQFLAGLNVNWALFDGFKTRNRMELAQNNAEVAKVQVEQTRQQIALDIRQQYQTREEARTRIATAREGLSAAQEAYRLAVQRFKVGLATTFEVTDVHNTLVQSSNNYVQATNDLRVAELRLARALGVDLTAYLSGKATTAAR